MDGFIRLQTVNTSPDILIYLTCIWLNVEICCMDGLISLQTVNASPDILISIQEVGQGDEHRGT